jgi:3-oxoadipate enol-lactonase
MVANALINGVEVYYEVSGDGPPLLFINGSGSTIDDVRPLIQLFVPAFEVAIADFRGMGRTSIPEAAYAMADLASDAIGLADHLGWHTFSLIGVSFGGMVAQEVAVTVPERIRRLVLMCTSSGGAGGSSYPLHELAQLEPGQRAAQSAQIMDTRFTPEWLAAHPEERALLDQLARQRNEEPTADAERGAELQLQARAGHDVFDRLPRITSPTLVASGRFDGIAPPENGAAIAAQIVGAELRLYDGGHGFFVQDPTAIPDVMNFLRTGSAQKPV